MVSAARRGIKGGYCALCGHDRHCESRCMWKQGKAAAAAALGSRRWSTAHVRARDASGGLPVRATALMCAADMGSERSW